MKLFTILEIRKMGTKTLWPSKLTKIKLLTGSSGTFCWPYSGKWGLAMFGITGFVLVSRLMI